MSDITDSLFNNLDLDLKNYIDEEDIDNTSIETKRDIIVKKLLKLGYPCKSIDEFNYMLPDSCVNYTYNKLNK